MTATSPTTACPCCGAYALPAIAERSALLAVCDVLTMKALSDVGKRICRSDRTGTRFRLMVGKPWAIAHITWVPNDKELEPLLTAWDVIPAVMGRHGAAPALGVTADQVTASMDDYVTMLIRAQEPHDLDYLRDWMKQSLGLALPDKSGAHAH